MEGLCWRCVFFWRCIRLPRREFVPSLLCPGAAAERCCSVVKVRQADILLSRTSSTERSLPAQDRAGPPAWASSFVPVGASQRLTGWWMVAAESDLEKTLSRVVQTPKELEGGCFGFFFFFFIDFRIPIQAEPERIYWNGFYVSTFGGWESFLSVRNLVYYSYRKPRQSEPIPRSS